MALEETPGPILKLIARGRHRSLLEPAPHIVGQRGDARVASGRELAQRLHHDRVERSAEAIAQRVRRAIARLADSEWRRGFYGAVRERRGLGARDRPARPLRFLLADDAGDFL